MTRSVGELGRLVAWEPVPPPRRALLTGGSVRLEPLDSAAHTAALYAAIQGPAQDPALWDYLAYGPFEDEASFSAWVSENAASTDPLFFAVIDLATGQAAGVASFLRITPEHGVVEIGHIWFGPALQRTRAATEAIFLLMAHAFDLDYRRVEWKCNDLNRRSRRAAERFGFTYEGTFRNHFIVKGRNRDTAWYAMTDDEWPTVHQAFETWLANDNFDAQGRQIRPLESIRAAVATDGE